MAQLQYRILRYVPPYSPPPFCGREDPTLTLTLQRGGDTRTAITRGRDPLEVIVNAIKEITGQQFAVEEVRTDIERKELPAILKTPHDASPIPPLNASAWVRVNYRGNVYYGCGFGGDRTGAIIDAILDVLNGAPTQH